MDSAQFKPVSPPGYTNAATEPRSESADFDRNETKESAQLPIRS